ncbi:MAG TPA: hypothetical protein PK195_10365, partial [Ignavibacteriaceae bacterium]|nr:hypothetical protein [Ignavibacteriaceae bacterium]
EPQKPTIPPDELNRALVQAVNVYNGLINPNTNKPYTSREIEDDILLRAATNQYGISGAINDIVGQEILDITNYLPPLTGMFGTVVGKATGNQNLVKAAEINRGEAVADIAPFPLNALSGKKQSGGITDLIDTYKKVLRGELTTNPPKVEDLSTFDRAIADITPEGKYAELQPGQATGKLAWVKNLSKLTEESKAILYTDDFANVVSELSLMSDSPVTWRENIMKMADMMEVKQGDSVAAIYGTAVQKTLSDGFRAIVESGAIDQITSKWQATEGLRSNLTVISSQLNLTPDEFIKLTRDQPNAAKSMIRDYAALNNNMIMNQVLTDDGTQIIDQFKVFTDKKDPLPYRFEQVATEYAVTITDQLSDYVVKVYNIKPQSLAIRLSDLMKRIQSVLLLGFSPSFPVNNLINNIITRAAVGVFGFPNSDTWVNRMNIQTARMQESMSEFRGGIDQTQSPLTSVKEKINAKMHPGDSVDKLSALIGKASSKAPFSKLSGNIEAAESARANTVGQMQYMHYMWKPGKAIDLMDPVL